MLKSTAKDLCPPLIWRLTRRAITPWLPKKGTMPQQGLPKKGPMPQQDDTIAIERGNPRDTPTLKDAYLELIKSALINHLYAGAEKFPEDNADPVEPSLIGWDGYRRLGMMQNLIEDVLARNVPGDLVEAGVWQGGMTIFFRALLLANSITDRSVWNFELVRWHSNARENGA